MTLKRVKSNTINKIKTALSDTEKKYLEHYAKISITDFHLPVVEIGAQFGASTTILGDVAREYDQFVLSIDHHIGDRNSGRLHTCNTFINNIKARESYENIIPVVTNTSVINKWVHAFSGKYCMAFIDGAHDTDSVLFDFELCSKLVLRGGFFLFHDYGRFGVTKAVNEIQYRHGFCMESHDSLAVLARTL